MFTIGAVMIGTSVVRSIDLPPEKSNEATKRITGVASLIDLIGAITLIVLGALSLTGHGGSLITSLNAIPGGGWGMIGGGLTTIFALYLLARLAQYNHKLKIIEQWELNPHDYRG